MLGIFVGRQPIYNRKLEVIGYDLLFHRYEATKAEFVESDLSFSQAVLNTFTEIGADRLVGSGLAFVNLTRNLILEKYPLQLIRDRTVLEVGKNITVDNEIIDALRVLSERGFQIALDDVIDPDDVSPLLEFANIVKLDISAIEQARLKEIVATLRKHKVMLLADKVETLDFFDICRDLKFDFFQGFFLCRPNMVSGQRMPASRLAVLRLLTKIHDPNIEFRELNEIIHEDVTLSYRLLRLINSAFYARPKKIESLLQALTLLGIKRVQNWVSLLLLSDITDKPHYLVFTAMERAKMCELLALELKEKKVDMAFIVGMFSVLDALLDMPMEKVVSSLPVSDEISSALLKHEGSIGAVLHCVLAYQRGEWEDTLSLGLEPEMIRNAFLESLDWVTNVSSLL